MSATAHVSDPGTRWTAGDPARDVDGPVYVRLRRGEIPVIFRDEHRLNLDRADVLTPLAASSPCRVGLRDTFAEGARRQVTGGRPPSGTIGPPRLLVRDRPNVRLVPVVAHPARWWARDQHGLQRQE
jgi:hypothetical protein